MYLDQENTIKLANKTKLDEEIYKLAERLL
jgi:hypothetical protein